MGLIERQCDFTHALALLICRAAAIGLSVKIQEVNRLLSTQKEYVEKGVSKTLNSRHLDNLAVDMYIVKDGKPVMDDKEAYRPLGEYWESIGGRWGGRFGLEHQPKKIQDTRIGWDPFHFEFTREKA